MVRFVTVGKVRFRPTDQRYNIKKKQIFLTLFLLLSLSPLLLLFNSNGNRITRPYYPMKYAYNGSLSRRSPPRPSWRNPR